VHDGFTDDNQPEYGALQNILYIFSVIIIIIVIIAGLFVKRCNASGDTTRPPMNVRNVLQPYTFVIGQ